MLTRKGTVMSPRMERLWRYIREDRQIALDDWSTDECVEREQVALRDGERALVEQLARESENRDLACLLLDYRTIMNRRPSERVGR